MSRAFVKEDVEVPERSTRRRSASGLPPGALNYLTAEGARRLTNQLVTMRAEPEENQEEISRLESVLASATVVEPHESSDTVTFGATVTVQTADASTETYRIVGTDETEPGAVSWVSPIGKALLGGEIGQRINFGDGSAATRTIIAIK